MKKCVSCNIGTLWKKGTRLRKTDGVTVQIFRCSYSQCKASTSVDIPKEEIKKSSEINRKFSIPDSIRSQAFTRVVVTSAQNDTTTNVEFLEALKRYCEAKDARLVIIPIRYQNPSLMQRPVSNTWDPAILPYMMDEVMPLGDVQILGDLKIQATMQNPLNGLDPLTVGKTTIVGHAQIQMKSLPRLRTENPVILASTGTISNPDYSDTRAGYIAEFHHSLGAVVVEFDDTNHIYHLRHLVGDENNGFMDLGTIWTSNGPKEGHIEALITGDEHVTLRDREVMDATYFNDDSIVKTLKPKIIVRHDVLDSYSISHHHTDDIFLSAFKYKNGKTLENELVETVSFITESTPEGSKNVFVPSNHNSHLMKWLKNPKSAGDPINAKAYSMLRSLVFESMDSQGYGDPFVLFLKSYRTTDLFLSKGQSFKIHGIELGLHGDAGINGAKGSIKSISKLHTKTVIGHSHSPGIDKGCYQVGTSTPYDLEYTNGATSWMNTHCIINSNGKRQLLNIIRGRWCLNK